VCRMCVVCVSYVCRMCVVCVSYVCRMCVVCVSYVCRMCVVCVYGVGGAVCIPYTPVTNSLGPLGHLVREID